MSKKEEILKLVLAGDVYADIAKKMGVSKSYVGNIAKGHGINCRQSRSEEQRAKIEAAINSGCTTLDDIAMYLGVSPKAAYGRLYNLGMRLNDLNSIFDPGGLKPGDRFGDWEVLSLANKHHKKDGKRIEKKYNCLCTSCNRIFEVAKGNLTSGLSRRCRSCGIAKRQELPIVEVETGRRFESLHKASRDLDIDIKTLTYHLRKYSFYEINGSRLEFADKSCS